MNGLVRASIAILLCSSPALGQTPTSPGLATRPTAPVLAPGDNLRIEGIPAIPAALAEDVGRYTEFRAAGMSDWHPVRREMLIVTRFADTFQVHHVGMPLGARRQLTFFKESAGGASYQPTTGDYFIFRKDRGGDEFWQIYRYDLPSGQITLLTDGGRSQNGGAVWSAAGDRIVYSSTRRNGRDRDLYVMDPKDPKSDRLVLQVEGGGWGALDWTPDGRQILVNETISANEDHLYLLNLETKELKPLTKRPAAGEEPVAYGGGEIAPDGRGFYTVCDRNSEFRRLTYVDLATLEHTPLTESLAADVQSADLSPDGKRLAFVANENGVGRLRMLDVKTRRELPLPALPPGSVGGVQWHENGRDLGFTMTSSRTPSDVYSIDITDGKVSRWTESETGGIDTSGFAEAQLVKWKSFDGLEISGFLYRPPAKFAGKRPVVINIHGGPEGQARPGFLGASNYYLNELGVAIIYPNVRGSSGFGKTFLKLDNGTKREATYKDIGALLDWIATQPDLDANRIMVTGVSYGGHMTFAIATYFPDRIKAALPVVGISNFISFLERTEAYRRDLRRVEYGDERDPETRAYFERTAPLTNAAKVKAPMFVVQGANDPRVPLNEAEQMVARVRQNGTPVWYLVAADEGHGFRKKPNQDYQFYATVMFIREHLLK